MFIYLDESGDFYGHKTTVGKDNFFIVGGFVTGDAQRTAREFLRWRQRKFPEQIRYKSEVKFSDSGVSDDLRLQTLQYLAKQDIRIFYTFLNTKNIPPQYRKKKGFESGLLYTELVAQTLNLLVPNTDLEFRIYRDHRHLIGVSQTQFNEIIKVSVLTGMPAKTLIQIYAVDSTTNQNIQIADWICGALAANYHKKENGNKYFAILNKNIITSKEVFEDFWGSYQGNKKTPPKT